MSDGRLARRAHGKVALEPAIRGSMSGYGAKSCCDLHFPSISKIFV
jgi:hypothetical protein